LPTTDELAADLAAVKQATPTHEDLIVVSPFCCYAYGTPTNVISGASWMTLMTAPIPLRILSVALSFEYWSLLPSDTAYWQADLAAHTAAGFGVPFATRTTQNTGANANGAITARTAWTFDAATWGMSDLGTGDGLALKASPVGSPASSWRFPMVATIRYRPL
jgi:hypothetical protein